MNSLFLKALTFVLRWEGGYVNHPNDPGGATNKGVTQAVYDRYREREELPKRSVRFLEDAELREIYHDLYWRKGSCGLMPDFLAIAHMDWCVNTGVNRAIKHLQGVVGTKADGIWGPKSNQALSNAIDMRGEKELLVAYLSVREQYYRRLGARSRFRVFLKGWLNRLNALRKELDV